MKFGGPATKILYLCVENIASYAHLQRVSEGEVKEECGSSGDTSDDETQLTISTCSGIGPWKHSLFRIKT